MTSARWYPATLIVLAALGFADATYLTIEHYTTFRLPCTITHGCDIVTTSAYSEIFGVPVALLGAFYYVTILLGTIVALEFALSKLKTVIAYATTTGFLFSAWFVYAQLAIIHAICQYCMLSATTSTALFVVSIIALFAKTSSPSQSRSEAHAE